MKSIWTFACLFLVSSSLSAEDWPQWGGVNRDLVWREDGIVDKLPTDGLLPRVWSASLGEGYAGPAVANGKVFVMDFQRDGDSQAGNERVVCLDADSGEILWTHAYPVEYSISYPHGPRATPTVDEDRVYTVGAMGHLFCLDVNSGEVLWKKDYVEDYGTRLPIWGMASPPLIDGNQVIALVGGQGALLVSFNKQTGKELWRVHHDHSVGYCPPVILEFGGQRQLICWHPNAISAHKPENGDLLWQVPYKVQAGMSIATPKKLGDRLLVSSFYNGARMLRVSADSAALLWQSAGGTEITTDKLHSLMCTPIFKEEAIYGVDSYGQLRGLNPDTGERLWETLAATGEGRWWNAFIIPHHPGGDASQERFFIHNEQGELIIANLSPSGYEELSRGLLVEPTRPVKRRMTIWSHPAFAMQSVFARNDKEIVRVSLKAE